MYALVDCNNFYVSCERLFNPGLEGKAVVVLSNNDGCAISRSAEAKDMGIEMGTPAFLIKDLVDAKKVAVFSSNYTLYGDISDRVTKTVESFVPRLELYSIDEAFLDMHDLGHHDLLELGIKIKRTIKKNIGIPVTVGIAPTKTLAKMANRFAKNKRDDTGVYWAANKELIDEILLHTKVNDIWGIGKQYALFLRRNGYKTAQDLTNAPEEWIRKAMTVQGQRLYNELKGIPCFKWDFQPAAKKGICMSRSFGKLQTDKNEIKEALCNYAANCALKLRQQGSCCNTINIFIQTNPHRLQDRQYARSINIDLERPSNFTNEIIRYASKGLDIIFKEGYNYLKCGVIVNDIIPESETQISIFDGNNRQKNKKVMETMDKINKSLGKEIVRMSVQGFEKRYRLKAEYMSRCYTTNINDVLKVNS